MKRLFCLIIAAILLCAFIPFSASADYTRTHAYTGVNETRYTDDMIIYNTLNSYTGTNGWGYEVVVTEGIVTHIGGNNSFIPNKSNSFVVSGHGTSNTWLSENVIVGMTASYANGNVSFSYSSSATPLNAIQIKLDDAGFELLNAKNECRVLDYSSLESRLSTAKAAHKALKTSFNAQRATSLEKEVDAIITLCAECQNVEYRGVWVRPTQTSASEVDSYVASLYAAGVNMISVETMYNSTMIFPLPSGYLFSQNPLFSGFDVLQAYVNSCHSRGMELHTWVPVFYSGTVTSSNYALSLASKRPAWRALTNHGGIAYSTGGSDMIFLNPAVDDAVDELLKTYKYILQNYDIDGFQLDYIRYRDRTSTDDFGYDSTTIAKFKAAYPKYASTTITYNTSASYWSDWVDFRASLVTSFVKDMRELIDEVRPDVALTADVGADRSSAYGTLYQDPMTWLSLGLLDMLHPMAYGSGYASQMAEFVQKAGDRCFVVPGLGIFMDSFDAQDMLTQTLDMRKAGCAGVIYFQAAQYMSKSVYSVLKNSIFAQKATGLRFDDETAVSGRALYLKNRMQSALYLDYVSHDDVIAVNSAADALILASSNGVKRLSDELNALNDAIGSLDSQIAKTALLKDTAFIKKLIDNAPEFSLGVEKTFVTSELGGISYLKGCKNGDLGLTVAQAKIIGGSSSAVTKNGSVCADTRKIGTGMLLVTSQKTYTISVPGDLNGDGNVAANDYLMLKRGFLGTYTLSQVQTLSGALTNGTELVAVDYLRLKRFVLGTYDIYA